MAQLFNEEGKLVEAYTPEEVEEKLNEVRQQAIEEATASKQEEIDDLLLQLKEKESEIEKAYSELEKEKSKDKNLIGQRKIIEEKERKVEELEKGLAEMKSLMEQKINEIELKSKERVISDMINNLAGDNKDLAEKIRFFYDQFKGEPVDEKQIQERIHNSYILATGAKTVSPISSTVISSAVGMPQINTNKEKISSELQDLARKMGISDQELKKNKLI